MPRLASEFDTHGLDGAQIFPVTETSASLPFAESTIVPTFAVPVAAAWPLVPARHRDWADGVTYEHTAAQSPASSLW